MARAALSSSAIFPSRPSSTTKSLPSPCILMKGMPRMARYIGPFLCRHNPRRRPRDALASSRAGGSGCASNRESSARRSCVVAGGRQRLRQQPRKPAPMRVGRKRAFPPRTGEGMPPFLAAFLQALAYFATPPVAGCCSVLVTAAGFTALWVSTFFAVFTSGFLAACLSFVVLVELCLSVPLLTAGAGEAGLATGEAGWLVGAAAGWLVCAKAGRLSARTPATATAREKRESLVLMMGGPVCLCVSGARQQDNGPLHADSPWKTCDLLRRNCGWVNFRSPTSSARAR